MGGLAHRFVEAAYRSSAGRVVSFIAHALSWFQRPFMVYGFKDPATGIHRRYVRISSTVTKLHPKRLSIADHVWVGHYSVLDSSGELTIEEGVQIGVGVCVYTHGSQNSIRLLGREYVNIPESDRLGYVRAPVVIGRYTFVGSGVVILPGVRIGAGAIIGPNAVIAMDIPDRAIVVAPPSRVVGSTMDSDNEYVQQHGSPPHYFARTDHNSQNFSGVASNRIATQPNITPTS